MKVMINQRMEIFQYIKDNIDWLDYCEKITEKEMEEILLKRLTNKSSLIFDSSKEEEYYDDIVNTLRDFLLQKHNPDIETLKNMPYVVSENNKAYLIDTGYCGDLWDSYQSERIICSFCIDL